MGAVPAASQGALEVLVVDDSDFEDEIVLISEDEDVECIEILSSDLEDEDGVESQALLLHRHSAQQQHSTGPGTQGDRCASLQQPHEQHCQQVVDLCGSQPRCYVEEQAAPREVYNMYVDGSCRDKHVWPRNACMSAGGYASSPANSTQLEVPWFDFSVLVVGGHPDSTRAELGAIWVGCQKLQKAIDQQLISTSTSEVHLYTDSQGAALMLKRTKRKVKEEWLPLLQGIRAALRSLKAQMPVRLKWVKGHQAGEAKLLGHGYGNDEAHKRSRATDFSQASFLPSRHHTSAARAATLEKAAVAAYQATYQQRHQLKAAARVKRAEKDARRAAYAVQRGKMKHISRRRRH